MPRCVRPQVAEQNRALVEEFVSIGFAATVGAEIKWIILRGSPRICPTLCAILEPASAATELFLNAHHHPHSER